MRKESSADRSMLRMGDSIPSSMVDRSSAVSRSHNLIVLSEEPACQHNVKNLVEMGLAFLQNHVIVTKLDPQCELFFKFSFVRSCIRSLGQRRTQWPSQICAKKHHTLDVGMLHGALKD